MEIRPENYLSITTRLSTPEEDKKRIEAYKNSAPRRAEILVQLIQTRTKIIRLREDLNLPNPDTPKAQPR